jgi:hypothetical protein
VPNETDTLWLGIAASWAAVSTPGWRTAPVIRSCPGGTGTAALAETDGGAPAESDDGDTDGGDTDGGGAEDGGAEAAQPASSGAISAAAANQVTAIRICAIPGA